MRAGFSLIELLVASSLLMLLTTALFLGWVQGARAWMVASQRSDLTIDAQIAMRRLERALEASASPSLAFQTDLLSYASSFGLKDGPAADQSLASADPGSLQWQKYVVIYRDTVLRVLRLREVAVPSGNSAYQVATPLPDVDFGSGPQTLPTYASGGSKFCEHVDQMEISRSGLVLTVRLQLSDGDRKGNYQTSTRLRN